MTISATRRRQPDQSLPPAADTITRLNTYMATLDLTVQLFAPLIGYSASALRQFLSGRYGAHATAKVDHFIREAAELYMARHPLGVDGGNRLTTRLYETANTEQMRYWFRHCIEHGSMAVIYGPPGSQKTFVAEHLIAELNRQELGKNDSNRAYLVRCSVNIRPRDLIAKICKEVGVPSGSTLQNCLNSIRLGLRGRNVLLIIDEAQLANIPALEALRELHDQDHVGLLLMGSHALRQIFERRAAELEQFNSRIEDLVELKGVTEESARAILAIEVPQLDPDLAAEAVSSSFVPDIYSRQSGKTYCSMRRLFKSINAFRELEAEERNATHHKEPIQ